MKKTSARGEGLEIPNRRLILGGLIMHMESEASS